jgi:hypothetical protein
MMTGDLTAPSRRLRAAIREANIPRPKGEFRAMDSRSPEFNRLIELVLDSNLAESKLMVTFHRNPRAGDKRPLDYSRETPFYQLSKAILEGFDFETDSEEGYRVLDLLPTYYLLGPARDVIPRILNTLRHPPADTCPIAHSYPAGTCIINVHFHFKKFSFAGRFYRE